MPAQWNRQDARKAELGGKRKPQIEAAIVKERLAALIPTRMAAPRMPGHAGPLRLFPERLSRTIT
jgi:hypothetical protein